MMPRNTEESAASKILAPIIIMIVLALVFSFVMFLLIDGQFWSPLTGVTEADNQMILAMIAEQRGTMLSRYISMLTGDFGVSDLTGIEVSYLINTRISATLILLVAGVVVTLIFAIPMGILSAVKRGTAIDVFCSAVAVVYKSLPIFGVALFMLSLFSFSLGLVPAGGNHHGIWSMILPVLTLSIFYFGFAMQTIRATAIKALDKKSGNLIFPQSDADNGSIIQSAVLPTISKSGLQLGWLFFGVIIVETLFALPGVGRLFFEGVAGRDLAVMSGSVMTLLIWFGIAAVIIGLIFAGITYGLRVSKGEGVSMSKGRLNIGVIIGATLVILLIIIALFASVLATHDPFEANPVQRLTPPSPEHLFGADSMGRDVYSRVLYGLRNTLGVSFLAVLISLVIGGIVGGAGALLEDGAGVFGKIANKVAICIGRFLGAGPGFLLAIVLANSRGRETFDLAIAVAFVLIPGFIRVFGGVVLCIKSGDAVRAFHMVIAQMSLSMALGIMFYSALGFLGLGAFIPIPELGSMIAMGSDFLRFGIYLVSFPGLALVISMLSFNILGESMNKMVLARSE